MGTAVVYYLHFGKKLLAKPPGEPEVKIRKLAKKTSHSGSVNKKTIIYTSEAFPAAVASQASKSSDLHTADIIWFSKSKQKQKRLQLNRKRLVLLRI